MFQYFSEMYYGIYAFSTRTQVMTRTNIKYPHPYKIRYAKKIIILLFARENIYALIDFLKEVKN